MNKGELIRAVAKNTNYTIGSVSEVVDNLFEVISNTVSEGDDVAIQGFGKFTTNVRAAREIRNPRTGELMDVPEMKTVKFTVGSDFKKKVRG